MRKVIIFAILAVLQLTVRLSGQTDERVLIRINQNGITAEEFVRLFTKNLTPDEKPDFDQYFEQFLIFRLKVAEAAQQGIDTTTSFIKEFEGYRSQLARTYLTDNEAREELLKNAYGRLQYEINAWHILVGCRPETPPADTLIAWRKAMEIRARILEGEPFELVARATSDDPSVLTTGGDLGWFTAQQMIKPFEDAAYSMKPGELSMPVRTPYGYHIIKLVDSRPSSGRIKVAHIMKALPPGASEDAWAKAEHEIGLIHKSLLAGEPFSELALKESDHRESAENGGELEWFGSGEIVQEFSKASFALLRNGDISSPVRTPYGWHIIKRIDRKPLGSFEENRGLLEARFSESHMTTIARTSLVKKLKIEYNYVINQPVVDWFIAYSDTLLSSGITFFDKNKVPAGNLFEFDGGNITAHSFAGLLESNMGAFNGMNTSSVINQLIDNKTTEALITYEDSRLEMKYPDFRYLVKEFHDGMLLFEINSREVWNKPYNDTTGLQNFFQRNNEKYMGLHSADITVYSLKSPAKIKPLAKLVSRHGLKPGGNAKILEKYITGNDTALVIFSERLYHGEKPELDRYLKKRGSHNLNWNGMESVMAVNKIYPEEPLPLDEVKHEVIADYQDYLEEKWVGQLKKKYSVWVNDRLLAEIREKLNGKR
jgi:peptidyl-prolyl cis-trans isomerase SurA